MLTSLLSDVGNKGFSKNEDIHKNQAINYLEVYNIADGLLINFGGLSLDFKIVYNKKLVNLGYNFTT